MATQPTPAQQQETKKRLALSIIDFLTTSLDDGTLSADDRDSVDVATNCIADAFKVDAADTAARPAAPQDKLLSIYTVYERLRGKTTGAAGAGPSAASAPAGAAGPSAEQVKEAEALKSRGNAALQKKNHAEAVDLYTQAIALNPSSAIYLSNRAAAYSAQGKHDLAKADAEMATAADPKYTKGWSRLGLARFALGDAQGSMEAYERGIEAEGSGGSDAMRKGYETAKRKVEEQGASAQNARDRSASPTGGLAGGAGGGMPDLSSLANMFGGGGGAGGAGGMPDLGALLQNPMMRQMAERVMANPEMMNNLMSNPQIRDMANQFGGAGGEGGAGGQGGGMPDLNALMSDPNLAEMARNFMGGAGGGAGAGRGGPGAGR